MTMKMTRANGSLKTRPTTMLLSVLICLMLLNSNTLVIDARSDGVLPSCDLTPTTVGTQLWPYGYVGRNTTLGANASQDSGTMRWAVWPQPTTFYTLRTSDDSTPGDDSSVYLPGEWTEIHLRVLDLRRRWIGLALYATNGTRNGKDSVVGSWSIPPNTPLQVIQCTANKGSTVTHIDANLKPLRVRVFFTAPIGTGQVTFKMLIKQGEQNKGNFFYLQQPFKLKEGLPSLVPELPSPNIPTSTGEKGLSSTIVSQSVIGIAGRACADVCLSQTPATPYCHANATRQIMDSVSLATATKGKILCRLPFLRGCPYAGVAHIDSDGFCSFRDETTKACPKLSFAGINQSTTPPPNICFTAAHATNRPICICTNDRLAQPINPFQMTSTRRRLLDYPTSTVGEIDQSATSQSAASTTTLHLTSIIMSILVGISCLKFRHFLNVWCYLIALVFLFQPSMTSAHNYIKSLHRARIAAVSVPCQQRIGNQPHVQVIRDQLFEIEWSLGHGMDWNAGDFYFATTREEDAHYLAAANITNILVDYLNLAPYNSSNIPSGWNKQHLRLQNEGFIPSYFSRQNVTEQDPEYIQRDPAYRALAQPSQYQNSTATYQHIYRPEFLQKDRRATYQSAKYPWLLSVAIFFNHLQEHAIFNNQADIAHFRIPSYAGTGNHIIYFNWSGYKDCVDINVVDGTTPVKNRYGIPPPLKGGLTQVVKLDHCEFNYIGNFLTPCHVMNPKTMDASVCIRECQAMNGDCVGVQVTRVTNPPGTLPFTPNIPFTRWYQPDIPELGNNCTALSVDQRARDGCPPLTATTYPPTKCDAVKLGLKPDDYICFGLNPLRDQNFQVQEDQSIAIDREDPMYYSSCLFLDPDRQFLNIPPVVPIVSSWYTVESCVDCAFHAGLSKLNQTQVPRWGDLSYDVCMNCDVINSATSVTTYRSQNSGNDLPAAGRKDALHETTISSSTGRSSSSSSSSSGSSSSSSSGSSSSSSSSASGGGLGSSGDSLSSSGSPITSTGSGTNDTAINTDNSDATTDSESNPSPILGNMMILSLIIIGAVVCLLLLAAGIFFIVKSLTSKSTLKRLQQAQDEEVKRRISHHTGF